MTTREPTPPPTHHCVNCAKPLYREDPEWPWKDPRGKWKCPGHPRAGQSVVTPHVAAPGVA